MSATPDVNRELESLLEAAGDVVIRFSHSADILYASNRTCQLLNSTNNELYGVPFVKLLADADHHAFEITVANTLEHKSPQRVEVRVTTQSAPVWIELQISPYQNRRNVLELLAVGRDISAHRVTEEQLRHMATHDSLTGLPNRLLLSDRLRMTIARSRRTGQGFSVAMLDLDGFKKVNDVLGHPVGDELLRMATGRLLKACA